VFDELFEHADGHIHGVGFTEGAGGGGAQGGGLIGIGQSGEPVFGHGGVSEGGQRVVAGGDAIAFGGAFAGGVADDGGDAVGGIKTVIEGRLDAAEWHNVAAQTETVTATETVAEAPAEEPVAEEPVAEAPAEEPAAEPVAMTVPTPEEVTPVFVKAGCIGCHVVPGIPGAVGAVGPNLSEIGVVGATRIDGYTVEEYLYESLLNPNAYIAPECPTGPCLPGLMIQNLGDILTAEEIDMVVAYLATMGVE